MWRVRNKLQRILRQITITSVAPNLTKSLPCLLWGVGCDSQLLGLLAKIGGLDPIRLGLVSKEVGTKFAPCCAITEGSMVPVLNIQTQKNKHHTGTTGIKILAAIIWAVATAHSTEHDYSSVFSFSPPFSPISPSFSRKQETSSRFPPFPLVDTCFNNHPDVLPRMGLSWTCAQHPLSG